MSMIIAIFVYMALLLVFMNAVLHLFVFKRYKVSLMHSPVSPPPMFLNCLLGSGIGLFLISYFFTLQFVDLSEIAFLVILLWFFLYVAHGVWLTYVKICEIKKKKLGMDEGLPR